MKIRHFKITLIMSATLAVLMLVTLLAGCSGQNTHGLDPQNPTRVTVWTYYNGSQAITFDALVSEFNRTVGEEKGIIVSAESMGSYSNLIEQVSASINKKVGSPAMPTLFQCYKEEASAFDKQGALGRFDEYFDSKKLEEYVDAFVSDGRIGASGSLILFPYAKSTEVLMVNKTEWDKFSAATGADIESFSTWEGLAKTAERYYEYSGGKAFFGRDSISNYFLCGSNQLGHPLFEGEMWLQSFSPDNQTLKKLWDNYYIPYVKGFYKHAGRYRSDDLKTGEIVAAVCSTTGSTYFPKQVTIGDNDPYDIERLVLPVPNFSGTQPYAVQQGASMAMAITDEPRTYAACVFMDWLTESEQNLALCAGSGYMPVRKQACNRQAIEEKISSGQLEVDPVVRDALLVAVEQIETRALFSANVQTSLRELLEQSFQQQMDDAISDAMKRLEQGQTPDEAYAQALDDSRFDEWLDRLNDELV